jgi:mRNA interferase MazF
MDVVTRSMPLRGDVHLVQLDPTRGSEIRKTRPCVIVSPDDLNTHLRTVIIAPMTTSGRAYPFRVSCRFQNRSGFVALDQLRTVDSERLVQRLGKLSTETTERVLGSLQEMFSQ